MRLGVIPIDREAAPRRAMVEMLLDLEQPKNSNCVRVNGGTGNAFSVFYSVKLRSTCHLLTARDLRLMR